MRTRFFLALPGLLALLAGVVPGTPPGAAGQEPDSERGRLYALLPESRLEVRTGTAGILGRLADRHVVRAGAFSGSVCYFPEDVARSSVRVEVPADSLRVETQVDEDDRASIRESMLIETLQAERFPTIRFRSTAVRRTEEGLEVEGDLTLVGETRPVTVELELETAGTGLWAWGSFSIRQTNFGIEPYSAGMGTIQVSDRVTFVIEARARRTVDEGGNPRSCS